MGLMSLNNGINVCKIEKYSQIHNVVHTLVTLPYLIHAGYYYDITSKSFFRV